MHFSKFEEATSNDAFARTAMGILQNVAREMESPDILELGTGVDAAVQTAAKEVDRNFAESFKKGASFESQVQRAQSAASNPAEGKVTLDVKIVKDGKTSKFSSWKKCRKSAGKAKVCTLYSTEALDAHVLPPQVLAIFFVKDEFSKDMEKSVLWMSQTVELPFVLVDCLLKDNMRLCINQEVVGDSLSLSYLVFWSLTCL
jgi:hypothetical protein